MSVTNSLRSIIRAANVYQRQRQRDAKPAFSALTGFVRCSAADRDESSERENILTPLHRYSRTRSTYARQCLMVAQPDEGSIPSGSTKLFWKILMPVGSEARQSNPAGPNWFRRRSLMVRSSCRTWTLSLSVYQTTKAKNIMAKVAGFLKSLVPDFSFGEFAPATMAA